jgi:hypothetical protein
MAAAQRSKQGQCSHGPVLVPSVVYLMKKTTVRNALAAARWFCGSDFIRSGTL